MTTQDVAGRADARSQRLHRPRSIPLTIAVIASLWIVHTVTRYFARGIESTRFWRDKTAQGFEPWLGWRATLLVHAGAACLAIAVGILAFLAADRHRWLCHRRLGVAYMAAVAISAAAGLPLALTASGGTPAVAAFLILNVAWLVTSGVAWRMARVRSIRTHRAWIGRSYAVTLANTTLHIITATLAAAGLERSDAYVAAAWACWPINLLLHEALRTWRHRRRRPAEPA